MHLHRRLRDAAGYAVEFIDRNLLHHRYDRICHFGWWLLNEGPPEPGGPS